MLGRALGRSPVIVVDDGSPTQTRSPPRRRARALGWRGTPPTGASRQTATRVCGSRPRRWSRFCSDSYPRPGFQGELLAHVRSDVRIVAPRMSRRRSATRSPSTSGGTLRSTWVRNRRLRGRSGAVSVRPKRCNGGAPRGARRGVRRGPEHRRGRRPGLAHARRRLADALDPRVSVAHAHRIEPLAWYRRRVFYNYSVAPLRLRHPTRLPVMYLTPPAAIAWSIALLARPEPIAVLAAARAAAVATGWRRGFRAPHGWR